MKKIYDLLGIGDLAQRKPLVVLISVLCLIIGVLGNELKEARTECKSEILSLKTERDHYAKMCIDLAVQKGQNEIYTKLLSVEKKASDVSAELNKVSKGVSK